MNPFYLKRSVLFLLIALAPLASYSQSVGISNVAITPDPESIMELRSTTKGVLLPRLNNAQRATLQATPLGVGDEGLTIFNTQTDRYNYWDGAAWVEMATSGAVTGLSLDDAYDAGGSGLGRSITADAGTVEILGSGGLYVNGNIGVGIAVPTMKLDVRSGDIGLDGLRSFVVGGWATGTPDVTPDAQMVLDGAHNSGFNLGGTKLLIRGMDNESNGKAISVVDENSNELFYIQSQPTNDGQSYFKGNVGVGTVTPGRKLEVIGDISLPSSSGNKSIYTWGPTDPNWRIGMSATPGFTRSLATSHVEYRTFASSAGQGFAVGDNVSGLSAFEVTGSGSGYDAYFRGDVGIGGNPTHPLHVTKTYTGNWQGRFTNGSSNVYLAHQSGYGMHINTGGGNSAGRYALEVRNGSQVHMYVRDDGRVGIRNSAPGYELDVTGNTRTTGDFFGDIHVDDTRSVNSPPTTYNNEVAFDFKNRTTVGVGGSGTYSGMMTFAPWGDNSGDASHQINFNEGGLFWRQGQPGNATWGAWDQIMTAGSVNGFVNHDNLGNHTATANLNMSSREIDNITYSDILAGNGYGMRFWSSNSYKIHMGNATEYRYGDVQDYSIKMNMNNDAQGDRGWTWGVEGQTPVASISTAGHMALDGSLFLDCVTCGSTSDPYPTGGFGWGNMVLQGRVMSANSNIHLSPPGGNNVVINDSYRAGGGSTGSGDAGLIVEGKAAIGQTTIDASYQLKVNGRLRTTGINETSDRRFKKDILPISDALTKVLTMEGVTYNWKIDEFPEQNFRDELQHGLIAQELEKIVPELVLTGSDGYKSIEYTHLVPVLIEALKEQQEIIDTQSKTLNAQNTKINELNSRVDVNSKTINELLSEMKGYSVSD